MQQFCIQYGQNELAHHCKKMRVNLLCGYIRPSGRYVQPQGQIWPPGKYTHHNMACFIPGKSALGQIYPKGIYIPLLFAMVWAGICPCFLKISKKQITSNKLFLIISLKAMSVFNSYWKSWLLTYYKKIEHRTVDSEIRQRLWKIQ